MTSTLPRPTAKKLELLKCQQDGIAFWKTIDFFPYDEEKATQLAALQSEDGMLESQLSTAAQSMGISAANLRQQISNYARVTQTPFCTWHSNASNEPQPAFFPSLEALAQYIQSSPNPEASENQLPAVPDSLDKGINILKRITPWIWAVVLVVVVIPLLGQFLMVKSLSEEIPGPAAIETVSPADPNQTQIAEIDWEKLERLAKDKMRRAHAQTEAFAKQELDEWVDGLTQRLDNNFLDWYFGYFHQKQVEYQSFFAGISGQLGKWLDPNKPSPQEKIAEEITKDFQEEFAKRVLVPQTSELQLQNISVRTAKEYIRLLGQEFNQLPVEQGVSAADWQRYLRETSITIPDYVGNPVSLPLKQLTTAGVYVVLKPAILPLIPKISSAVAGKMAAKAGAQIAAKTGGALAAKLGSTFLDAGVGAGILLWDVLDNRHTANVEKPILRENLVGYLGEIEESILENPQNGVMTVVTKIEQQIEQAIHITRDMDVSLNDAAN